MTDSSQDTSMAGSELPNINDEAATQTAAPAGKPAGKQPMPAKGGAAGILIVLIIVILLGVGYIVVNRFFSQDDQGPITLPEDEVSFSSTVGDEVPILSPDEAALPGGGSLPNAAINNRLLELEQEVSNLTTQIANQLDAVNKSNQNQDATLTQQKAFNDQVREVAKSVKQLQFELGELRKQITDSAEVKSLAGRVQKLEVAQQKAKKAQKAAQKNKKTMLPFRLVSVDLWNGIAYAAVSKDNKISLLTVDESLVGWIVEDIDFAKETVSFKHHKNGNTITRQVKR